MRKFIIIGGKGSSINIAEQIIDASINYNQPVELLGFAIDDPSLGAEINGVPVLCKIKDLYKKFDFQDVYYLYTLYRPDRMVDRTKLLYDLKIPLEKFINFIHPSSVVNNSVKIGFGNVVLSHCSIQSNVQLGNFNVVNSNVVIEHDTLIGNANFFAAASCIGSGVVIKDCSFIGLKSSIKENLNIGHGAFIGMGSNVVRDVVDGALVFGNPAKEKE